MWFVEKYENKASLGVKIKKKILEQQSKFQKISLYETEYFGKLLTLDGITMLSEKDEFVYHEMIVHMPLCVHKKPERVLVIGGGDGGTVREILKHDTIKEVILCEIDEQVVRLCQQYLPLTAEKLTDPRVKLVFEDGAKFIEDYENYFDLIITDSTDPIGPGKVLFQENYYRTIKKALKANGMMTCQSESPWFYADILRDMTNNMCKIFNHVETYIAMIPLYLSGLWTMTFASNDYSLKDFNRNKSETISKLCKYYNPAIHSAALTKPNFLQNIVNNK
jgi:spermidine synthase